MKTKSNEQYEETAMMMMDRFITIAKNDEHGRVDIHLRGLFESPQQSTREITELYALAEQYPTACVYINSDGGRIDTLMEIINVLKKFQSVITVVTSNAASAGFMLWCVGDVRVVCPHAEIMAHRETSGMIDKTYPMSDRIEHMKRRFDHLFTDLCSDLLSDDEMESAKRGELWFLGEDFIEREHAISWDQFCEVDSSPIEPVALVGVDDQLYMDVKGLLMRVDDITLDENAIYNPHQIIYGVPNPKNLVAVDTPTSEENTDGVAGDEVDSHSDAHDIIGSLLDTYGRDTVIGSEKRLRSILREVFGKGQYAIQKDKSFDVDVWTVYGKINGRMVYITRATCLYFIEEMKMGDFLDACEEEVLLANN